MLNEAKRKRDADTKDIKVPTNQHHIVAKRSPYAEEARNILLANNICPFTDQDNIVTVSTKMHQYMHNKVYFYAVNLIIKTASDCPYWSQEDNISGALRLIKMIITLIDSNTAEE